MRGFSGGAGYRHPRGRDDLATPVLSIRHARHLPHRSYVLPYFRTFVLLHAVTTSTLRNGSISDLGISAGQYATISCTRGRPPAKPVTDGGPVSTSGATSLVKRSTAAMSCPRTLHRTVTSARSRGMGPASGPCVAFQPTYSVSTSSNFSPSRSIRARRTRSAACAFSTASGQE